MKIFNIDIIRQADQYTIENEPISSIDLMERAARGSYHWITSNFRQIKSIAVFCGLGNNGGDGLAIARLLSKTSKYTIDVYILRYSDNLSEDFNVNLNRLEKCPNVSIIDIYSDKDFILNKKFYDLGIDCIFGSGLNKPISGWLENVINSINNADIQDMISIDIPSGLFADIHTPVHSPIIKATHTLSFSFPKLAFMFPESGKYVGEFHIIDIHLHPDFLNSVSTNLYYTDSHAIQSISKKRNKFSHKGTYGHALVIAGSYGKTGASVLSTKATLRSGAGLVTSHLPQKCVDIMQTNFPETMVSIDNDEYIFSSLPENLEKYNAIGIGPGLGTHEKTASVFKKLLKNVSENLVIDADAINLLSIYPELLNQLPENTIITPHIKEFERLTGVSQDDFERFEKQKDFSKKYKIIVVLKGAHTCITFPSGETYFNSTGNPGMATAGMGDVLTGIITGLLAQHYTPYEAAIYGVYLHGKAGDIAVSHHSQNSLIASDLIDFLR